MTYTDNSSSTDWKHNLDINEAIAIIGISCRFPKAANHHQFWNNLRDGIETVSHFSNEELLRNGVPESLLNDPNYVKAGYVLEEIDRFDAEFFGYVGKEAEYIDPQQRLFLMCAWEALEDGGYAPIGGGLPDQSVGIFAGCRISSYLNSTTVASTLKTSEAFQALIGNDKDYLCSRVAYKLNLRGPCVGVQTACSSSLIAVHQACENLRNGCCDLAIAGGVAINIPHRVGYLYQPGMILSPDGYCRAFDAEARGTVFSNGVGVVLLKRLQDALADKDALYAVIRGSSVNNDGASKVGYTAPGLAGQAAVIHEALGISGVAPRQVGYIEAHGTGTAIGDPIEIEALTKVFREDTDALQFCPIGSVKSNIGHADAAAGMAGLLKTVLSLYHKKIPPSLYFERPNPELYLDQTPFYIADRLQAWEQRDFPRIAGVSAFGIGGSNAHMVLEEPHNLTVHCSDSRLPEYLFTLSSRTSNMLRQYAGRIGESLARNSAMTLDEVCFTTAVSRSGDRRRLAAIVSTFDELGEKLRAYAAGKEVEGLAEVQLDTDQQQSGTREKLSVEELFTPAGAGENISLKKAQTAYLDGAEIVCTSSSCSVLPGRVHLPPVPFQGKRYWLEKMHTPGKQNNHFHHPLLDTHMELPGGKDIFSASLTGSDTALLREHKIFGVSLAPLSMFCEIMAAVPGSRLSSSLSLSDIVVQEPLFLDGREIEFRLLTEKDNNHETDRLLTLHGRQSDREESSNEAWIVYARGRLSAEKSHPDQADIDVQELHSSIEETVSVEDYYSTFRDLGIEYGPSFRKITALWKSRGRALARIEIEEEMSREGFFWHPAVLDSCLQPAMAAMAEWVGEKSRIFIPTGCRELDLKKEPGTLLYSLATVCESNRSENPTIHLDFIFFKEDGTLLGRLNGLEMRPVNKEQLRLRNQPRQSYFANCYHMNWQESDPVTKKKNDTRWILAGDGFGLAEQLADYCRDNGRNCTCLTDEPGRLHNFLTSKTDYSQTDEPKTQKSLLIHLAGLQAVSEIDRDNISEADWQESWKSGCLSVMALIKKLSENDLLSNIELILVTREACPPGDIQCRPGQAILWGMHKVITLEYPRLKCRIIDIDPADFQLHALLQELSADTEENAVVLRGAKRYVRRLEQLPRHQRVAEDSIKDRMQEPFLLTSSSPGLENLVVEQVTRRSPKAGEVEVEMTAASLNFRDVMMAMGLYPGKMTELGSDGAGIIVETGPGVTGFQTGDRVMVSSFGCLRSHITLPVEKIRKTPRNLSDSEAAGLPVVYLTAAYALTHLVQLRSGMKVLIHAAAGGVGQAALAICKAAGAEIYATAGSEKKRHFLIQKGIRLVMDSRSLEFEDTILKETEGKGVDAVLNSTGGEALEASLRVVARGGTFLEIGKVDALSPDEVRQRRPDINYHLIDLVNLGRDNPELMSSLFSTVATNCEQGVWPSLPVQTFPFEKYVDAFRFMVEAGHIGKIVLTRSVNRKTAYAELISGGLGGLGLALARWRAKQGLRHLVLVGRNAPGQEAQQTINQIQEANVKVHVFQADVSNFSEISSVMEKINEDVPPLKAVYHLAGVIDDDWLFNLDEKRFTDVLNPKTRGSWNLHLLTRDMNLERFVLFSSSACVTGTPGQTHYAGANAYLDALAHYRRHLGLAATSINWGPFKGTGMVEKIGLAESISAMGIHPLDISTNFKLLFDPELTGITNFMVLDVDWETLLQKFSLLRKDPFFERIKEQNQATTVESSREQNRTPLFKKMSSKRGEKRIAALMEYLRKKTAVLLKIDEKQLDPSQSLLQMGVDSLIALDLFQTMAKELGIHIEQRTLFEYSTINQLAEKLAESFDSADSFTVDVADEIHPQPDQNDEPFNLVEMQQAYWIGRTDAVEFGNISCHVYMEIDSEGIDLDRYRKSWQKVIARHGMLRMQILPDGRQRIRNHIDFDMEIVDLQNISMANAQQSVLDKRAQMSHEVLPADESLFKVAVSLLPDGRNRLHIGLDLLIADLLSMNILIRDLVSFYKNPEYRPEHLELSFRDYVLALEKKRQGSEYAAAKNYWMKKLPDLPGAPELPKAGDSNTRVAGRFARKACRFDKKKWQRLQDDAATAKMTPSGLLLALYAETLARWSRTKDFSLNVTLFQRLPLHRQINEIVGDFTTMCLVEVHHDSRKSFIERALSIQEQLWKDMEHNLFSGVEAVREWVRLTGRSSTAVMPVVFTSTLGLGEREETHPLLTTFGDVVYTLTQTPQVWIDFQVRETEGCLDLNWDFAEGVFPADMIDDMFESFCRLLEILATDKEAWTRRQLPALPPSQVARRRLVNATRVKRDTRTLYDLFRDSLLANPDAPALITGERTFSYSDLSRQAGAIADHLQDTGLQQNELAAVIMTRGREEIAAILGILAAGGAYLPIDVNVPARRLSSLLSRSGVEHVITDAAQQLKQWPENIDICSVHDLQAHETDYTGTSPVQTSDLAYIIYTSGSTGKPKGVMIDNGAAVNTISAVNRLFDIRHTDKVLALSSLSFDLSVWDIFGMFAAGGTIVMPDQKLARDPAHWSALIRRHHVTVWNSVPALMQMFLEYEQTIPPTDLQTIMLSGDWIPVNLAKDIRQKLPEASLIALGGATEASIWSNFYPIVEVNPHWSSIPYGRPLPNQTFFVLDNNMLDCPDWVAGNLYIGGAGLARGYKDNPERTQQQFVIHPTTGEPLYSTGDLGRYLPDGNLEFLGREDFQVKINGYRIELGEVEATLARHPLVAQGVVVDVELQRQRRGLVALVIPSGMCRDTSPPLEEQLRKWMNDRLPSYMVPGVIKIVPEFPLNPTGKIDRKKLAQDYQNFEHSEEKLVLPETEMEQTMAELLAGVLGTQKISVDSRFFELGISSVDLVSIQALFQEKLGVELSIMTLLEHTTIRRLARHLHTSTQTSALQKDQVPQSMDRAQRRKRRRKRGNA